MLEGTLGLMKAKSRLMDGKNEAQEEKQLAQVHSASKQSQMQGGLLSPSALFSPSRRLLKNSELGGWGEATDSSWTLQSGRERVEVGLARAQVLGRRAGISQGGDGSMGR